MVAFVFMLLSQWSLTSQGTICQDCPTNGKSHSQKLIVPEQKLLNCQPHAEMGKEELAARAAAEASQLPPPEILARLIYSESLSTGFWNHRCEAPGGEKSIFEVIGWGIASRIQKQLRTKSIEASVKDVVFQPKNFRTSFSNKNQNPFARTFLCPSESESYFTKIQKSAKPNELYRASLTTAINIINILTSKQDIPIKYQGITNFFYPYSEFFGEMRPPWASKTPGSANKGYINIIHSTKPCVEFYSLK